MKPSQLCISFNPDSKNGEFTLEFVKKYLEEVANKNSEATFAGALNDLIGASIFTLKILQDAKQTTLQ